MTGSAPIATSTPVNFATGTVSPPPLTLAPGPGPPHQEQPVQATPTAKVTTYPAVLKGRTAASPPNPNLVPSGKIPPPVPPRGSGQSRTGRSSEEHRGPGTATSTSSMASSRGDEAAIITRYRLHESSSRILHHLPSPDNISTSATVSAAPTATTNSAASRATSLYTGHDTVVSANTATSASYSDLYATSAVTRTSCTAANPSASAFYARARQTTPADLPPRYDSLAERPRSTAAAQSIREERPPRQWNHWTENMDEEEEFVSVEKVNGSYVIRTSPYPFRPERGNFKHPREKMTNETGNPEAHRSADGGPTAVSRAQHMAKFTYFLNPASRPELMNYKMSRKDKKHSETYYERMKRKQTELESSITTITTLARRGEHASKIDDDRERIEASEADRPMASITRQERTVAERKSDSQTSKSAEHRRDSRLLRKIKEKSAQRRKKLAPEPSPVPQPFAAPARVNYNVDSSRRKDKTEACKEVSSRPNYGNAGDQRLTKSTSDVRIPANEEAKVAHHRTENRTFLVTKVQEAASAKCKSAEVVYASGMAAVRVQESSFRIINEATAPANGQIYRSNDRISYRLPDRYKAGANSQSSYSQTTGDVQETPSSRSGVQSTKSKQEKSRISKPMDVLTPNASFLHTYEKSQGRKF